MKSLIEIAENGNHGKNVIFDWLGSGGTTVSSSLAQARANLCIGPANGHPCPLNNPESGAVHLFGEALKKIIEIKNRAKLRVDGEKKLGGCDGCSCHLRTKIWTPMNHIRKHTPDAELLKLPAYCWQRKENHL